jgi:hypothetical protein
MCNLRRECVTKIHLVKGNRSSSALSVDQRSADRKYHANVRHQSGLLVPLLAPDLRGQRQEAIYDWRDATADRTPIYGPRFGIAGRLPGLSFLRPVQAVRNFKLLFPRIALLHVFQCRLLCLKSFRTALLFDMLAFSSRRILLSLAHFCGKNVVGS